VVLAAVSIVTASCSSNDKPANSAAGTTTTSGPAPTAVGGATTTAPAVASGAHAEVVAAAECRGIGAVPSGGEVTWLKSVTLPDKRIVSELDSPRGCLLRLSGPEIGIEWSGAADHVLIGGAIPVGKDGPVPLTSAIDGAHWSRPAGKSLLRVDSGRLLKRPLAESDHDITFLRQHDGPVAYHPAGSAIVAVGTDGNKQRLVAATNTGRLIADLVATEEATRITDVAFTSSGALLFVAEHDDRVHLHRLEFDPSKVTTIDTFEKDHGPFNLTVSPLTGGGVAYTYLPENGCGERSTLWASRGGRVLPTKGTKVEHMVPAGWMADGSLVVIDRPPGCDLSPGDLYTFKDGKITKIADQVDDAAVRAVLPPPPPQPRDIPSEAPG
jgi:hypothetical protein